MIVNFNGFLIGVSERENKNDPTKKYYSCNILQGGDQPTMVDVEPEIFPIITEYQRKELAFTADYVHFYYNQRWITRLVVKDAKPI